MIEYLTLEDALLLIEELAVGPVRDLGLVDSALHRPAVTLWGRDAYTTIDEKAAALLDSLVRNHPLVDGNKRLGWLATLVFLDINGHWIEAPDDDAYQLVIAVAAGELSLEEVALALSQWRCEPEQGLRQQGQEYRTSTRKTPTLMGPAQTGASRAATSSSWAAISVKSRSRSRVRTWKRCPVSVQVSRIGGSTAVWA